MVHDGNPHMAICVNFICSELWLQCGSREQSAIASLAGGSEHMAPPAPPAHAALSDTILRWPVPYPLYTSALPYTPRGHPRLYPVPYPLPLLSSPYPTHLPSSASARDLLPTPLHLWQTSASFTISQSHTLTGNFLQFTFAAVRSFISCISRLQSTF